MPPVHPLEMLNPSEALPTKSGWPWEIPLATKLDILAPWRGVLDLAKPKSCYHSESWLSSNQFNEYWPTVVKFVEITTTEPWFGVKTMAMYPASSCQVRTFPLKAWQYKRQSKTENFKNHMFFCETGHKFAFLKCTLHVVCGLPIVIKPPRTTKPHLHDTFHCSFWSTCTITLRAHPMSFRSKGFKMIRKHIFLYFS